MAFSAIIWLKLGKVRTVESAGLSEDGKIDKDNSGIGSKVGIREIWIRRERTLRRSGTSILVDQQ